MNDKSTSGYQGFEDFFGKDFVEEMDANTELQNAFDKATSSFQQRAALRKYYLRMEKYIMQVFRESKFLWATTYPLGDKWKELFTPIEEQAWNIIRSKGRIVLYPQYPILDFYADFANPGLKIVLELDGKQYHDRDKDLERDKKMKAIGWTVYRVTGKEIYNTRYKDWSNFEEEEVPEEDRERCLRNWLMYSGDGVIEAIKAIHFGEMNYGDDEDNIEQAFIRYCHETLRVHQLS